ncbi:hypothetical protein ACPA54_08985 [Uniformispora flossi]|uniref:hypothetical protein n=1 Tax=Uniformispora flossi TaxID=3390723 RepID=UPI003C2AF84B
MSTRQQTAPVRVAPADVNGYSTLLKFARDGDPSQGFTLEYLTIAQHRALAEALAAMLGVALTCRKQEPDTVILCGKCGTPRPRRELIDICYPSDRPGSFEDMRYVCIDVEACQAAR